MTRVAVILPCYNEEASIAMTVKGFRAALPNATIYVYDNASTDRTAQEAKAAGAEVRFEGRKGKANAIRRAFADIEADVFLMADGDATYDPLIAPQMIDQLLDSHLDMVVGARIHEEKQAYRPGHVTGNVLFSRMFRLLFGEHFADVFSGYRALSRRFVKSFPLSSGGFEIELEMATHVALLKLPWRELPCLYSPRGKESASKLRTYRDGTAILIRMLRFLFLHRARYVYGFISGCSALAALFLFLPIFTEYLNTGLVPRMPSLIVATAFGLTAVVTLVVGLVLDAQAHYYAATRRLLYLNIALPTDEVEP